MTRLVLLVALGCWACGGDAAASSTTPRGTRSDDSTVSVADQGGVDVLDAGPPSRNATRTGSADAGQSRGERGGSGGQRAMPASGGSKSMSARHVEVDAAAEDAGIDAAPASDAGARNSGSCCSTSDKPGCGDAALQACVCMQQPSCCSDKWDEACTRVIAEKFCQSGVRDCVCGSADGQWQQAECCEASWNDTCDSVATNKCGATLDCK